MGPGTGGLGAGIVGIFGVGLLAGAICGPGVVVDPPPGAISDPGSDFAAQGDAAQPVNAAASNKMNKRTSTKYHKT